MPDQFKKFLAYPLFLGLIADTAYLSAKYYKFYYQGGLLESLGCTDDCDTVMMSPYALLFKIPVPFYGLAFYALCLLAYIHFHRSGAKRNLEALLIFGSIAALAFIYLMYFELHAVCKFCLAAHAMFLSLTGLYYFVIARQKS